MTPQDLRNHIKKSVGFGVELPRTADPNERNETGDNCSEFRARSAARRAEAIEKHKAQQAVQVCSAGEWPEDFGGNWTPDRIAANHSFSDWLDSQGDSIVPSSFSEWLGSEDSIFIE